MAKYTKVHDNKLLTILIITHLSKIKTDIKKSSLCKYCIKVLIVQTYFRERKVLKLTMNLSKCKMNLN